MIITDDKYLSSYTGDNIDKAIRKVLSVGNLVDEDKLTNELNKIGAIDTEQLKKDIIEELEKNLGELEGIDTEQLKKDIIEELDNEFDFDGLSKEEAALFEEMSNWYKDQTYVKMTGTFSMTPSVTTYEMGSSKSVVFSWTFSKLPIEVKFNGETMSPAESGSKTVNVSSSSHTTLTYEIYGKYKEDDTVSKTFAINFRNKYYYGCATKPANIDSSFIAGLQQSNWAGSRTTSFTPNSTTGTYVWYAYPKRFGAATMWMGGFQGGFDAPITVSVTNSSGLAEDYYVYKSTNSGIGSLYIEAK